MKAFRTEFLTSLCEDIRGIIKSEIRSVLEKEKTEFRADINMVRSELQSYQTMVTAELAMLKNTTGEVEKSLSACTDDIVTLQQEVAHLKAQSKPFENKCEDLEARSHRSMAPAPRQGEQTRAVVARLHYFRDCANILRLAKEKQRIKMDGVTISIYLDYTVRVARARAGYNGVRQQLRGVEGVRYGILYPALRITHNNQERIFSTPEEAQSYISENISANRLICYYDTEVDRNVRKAELKSSIFGVLVERSIRFERPCPVSEGAGVVGEVSLAARTEAGVGAVPPHIAPVRLSAVGTDPALILRLKELELELQRQLNHAWEIETEKAVKLRQLELEEGNARQPVQEVYSALPIKQSLDYKVVKSAVLHVYELVPGAYRQNYRAHWKTADQTYGELAREKRHLFNKW
ncbi:hypothetical protein MHYP_G00088690 [Metynnis hypsauchen]